MADAQTEVTVVVRAINRLTGPLRDMGRSVRLFGRVTMGTFRRITTAATAMQRSILNFRSLLAGAATLATGKQFADFDLALRRVQNVMDEVTHSTQELGAAVKTVALDTGQDIDLLAEGLFNLQTGLQDINKSLIGLEGAATLATAANTKVDSTTKAITIAMRVWGDEISNVTELTDTFFAAQQTANASLEDIIKNFGRGATQAKLAGLAFEDYTGAIAALTVTGLNAAESVTAFRQFLTGIIKPTIAAQKAADDLGIALGEEAIEKIKKGDLLGFIQDLNEKLDSSLVNTGQVFRRVRALIAAAGLTAQETEILTEAVQRIAMRSGRTAQAFDRATDSLRLGADKLKQGFKIAFTEIGKDSEDFFRDLLERGQKLVNWLRENRSTIALWIEVVGGTMVEILSTVASTFVRLAEFLTSATMRGQLTEGIFALMKGLLTAAGEAVMQGLPFLLEIIVLVAKRAASAFVKAFFGETKEQFFKSTRSGFGKVALGIGGLFDENLANFRRQSDALEMAAKSAGVLAGNLQGLMTRVGPKEISQFKAYQLELTNFAKSLQQAAEISEDPQLKFFAESTARQLANLTEETWGKTIREMRTIASRSEPLLNQFLKMWMTGDSPVTTLSSEEEARIRESMGDAINRAFGAIKDAFRQGGANLDPSLRREFENIVGPLEGLLDRLDKIWKTARDRFEQRGVRTGTSGRDILDRAAGAAAGGGGKEAQEKMKQALSFFQRLGNILHEELVPVINILTDSVVGFFDAIIFGSESAGEAFKRMIFTMLRELNRLFLTRGISALFGNLFGVTTNASGGIASSIFSSGGPRPMAEGGVVSSPTLAMIGEGPRPEVVMPMSTDARGNLTAVRGGGGGDTHLHLSVHAIDTQTGMDFVVSQSSSIAKAFIRELNSSTKLRQGVKTALS